MDIRMITPSFAVSPQIEPDDLPAIKDAGFETIICNRPDEENPVELQAEVLRTATEAAGLRFIDNPLSHGQLTLDHVTLQGETCDETEGAVLAYCASGMRSSIIWALAQAGKAPTADIIAAAAQAGYDLSHLKQQIDMLAGR